MQRLADRASAVFVPAVLLLAGITFAGWFVVLHTHASPAALGRALQAAVSVLVVACPCAMGLAVPAAVTVAVGSAAQEGVLIKGGEVLERLARIDTCAFDKTGTLTEGAPRIQAMILATGARFDRSTLLGWAATVERLSTHPLAGAVVAFAEASGVSLEAPAVEDFHVVPGQGAVASLAGHEIAIGNTALVGATPAASPFSWQTPEQLRVATPLYMAVDGILEAAFYATDTVQPTSPEAVKLLHGIGVTTLLLTGDTEASAASVADTVGITRMEAKLSPEAKVRSVAILQQAGRRVAMAGDGLNDAAALAQADAGFAMASGTDLARESGGVLLLHPDLRSIPRTILLARRAVRIMRQNLGWALLYNVLALPVAAGLLYPRYGILLRPVLGSAAMALSSVSVLLNSLRLRRRPATPRAIH